MWWQHLSNYSGGLSFCVQSLSPCIRSAEVRGVYRRVWLPATMSFLIVPLGGTKLRNFHIVHKVHLKLPDWKNTTLLSMTEWQKRKIYLSWKDRKKCEWWCLRQPLRQLKTIRFFFQHKVLVTLQQAGILLTVRGVLCICLWYSSFVPSSSMSPIPWITTAQGMHSAEVGKEELIVLKKKCSYLTVTHNV